MKWTERLRANRSALFLLVALGCGALAVLATRGYINDQLTIERDRLAGRYQEIEVVVAKRDLKRGESVGGDTMAVRRLAKDFLPGGVVTPDRFEEHVGTRLSAAMKSGEPLLQALIEGADAATFSTRVREGIRALTISVDDVNSISGMLQPGDRIDLHLSIRPPSRPGLSPAPEQTAPLMQDVLVLATGRHTRPGHDDGRGQRTFTAITVEATPDQAQRLIVAQRAGRLTALLRNPIDRRSVEQRPLDVMDLLGVAESKPGRIGPAPPEVIVGGRGPIVANTAPQASAGLPMPSPGELAAVAALGNAIADRGSARPGAAAQRPETRR